MKTHKEVCKIIDNIGKRKGFGIRKKTLFSLVGTLIIIGMVASAGLITTFLTINTEITVTDTNIQVDDQNAPWTIQSSFSSKLPGDTWYEVHWINNTRSGTWYLIGFDAICDPGLSARLLNSTYDVISNVNATGDHMLCVEYALDLLCEPDVYNATIDFIPLFAGEI